MRPARGTMCLRARTGARGSVSVSCSSAGVSHAESAVDRDVVAGPQGCGGGLLVAERGTDEHAEPVGVVLRKGACMGGWLWLTECGSDTALWAALCSSMSRVLPYAVYSPLSGRVT